MMTMPPEAVLDTEKRTTYCIAKQIVDNPKFSKHVRQDALNVMREIEQEMGWESEQYNG